MTAFEEFVQVRVPVWTAYDQWTQFETFPQFMQGVERVEQLGDTLTRWRVVIGGIRREFDARIVRQVPDEQIAWAVVDGPRHDGVVRFTVVDPTVTRVWLRMDFEPHGVAETAADQLDLVRQRVRGDLLRFKNFIEARGRQTGGWRGEVPGDTSGTGGEPAR